MTTGISRCEMKEITEYYLFDYLGTQDTRGMNCIDVEGFALDYFGLDIVYENIAEIDRNRMGFLSDGIRPLLVFRDKKVVSEVFPENTIVLDNYLKKVDMSGKRRFTIAHEIAHYMLRKLGYAPVKACFCNEFDAERNYSSEELHELFNFNETNAHEMGSYIIMPEFLVMDNVRESFQNKKVPIFGRNVVIKETKDKLSEMADRMGVPYSSLIIQLKKFKMIEHHSMDEFMQSSDLKAVQT